MCTLIINPAQDRLLRYQQDIDNGYTIVYQGDQVLVGYYPDEEVPRVENNGNQIIISLGCHIDQARASRCLQRGSEKGHISTVDLLKLNGTFSHFIVSQKEAVIALDRFGSMTVFYAQTESNELVASTGYQSLLRILKKNDAGGLQESSIFEFLYMRRLFGEKTYHSGIRRMSAGTTLRFSFATSQIEKENYWSPPKEKLLGQEEVISSLTHGINESIEMYLSGPGCRHGLLLSGGLDSRMLLAVGRERYTTFTTARTMNNEVEVASSLADQVGAEHIYLQRQESYFADIFSRATVLSNAMTAFYECQFVGFQDELSKHVDVIHTGLFLDVFFCGHYLYKEHPQFLGRPRLDFQLRELVNGSEERNFLDNISYRLKTSSVLDVCDNRRADELRASLSRSIENKMKDGREYGFAGHDLWEYMHLTDLGRHYSMLMVASLKGRLGIAVPALENNLYDLAFMIPAEMKVNWSIYLQTLRKLSNSFSRIRSANNNISPRYPLRVQAGLNIGRSALRRFGILRTAGMPVPEDRSWPRLSSDLMHPNIRKKLESMVKEGKINDLTFIVPEKIENVYHAHFDGRHDHSVLLGLLLTLEFGLLRSNP